MFFNEPHGDLVEIALRHEAMMKFPLCLLPQTKKEWDQYRATLKNQINKKDGCSCKPKPSINLKETGIAKMPGYTIKNIAFQTRPGTDATANLMFLMERENSRRDCNEWGIHPMAGFTIYTSQLGLLWH
jgi:hypothetical protein